MGGVATRGAVVGCSARAVAGVGCAISSANFLRLLRKPPANNAMISKIKPAIKTLRGNEYSAFMMSESSVSWAVTSGGNIVSTSEFSPGKAMSGELVGDGLTAPDSVAEPSDAPLGLLYASETVALVAAAQLRLLGFDAKRQRPEWQRKLVAQSVFEPHDWLQLAEARWRWVWVSAAQEVLSTFSGLRQRFCQQLKPAAHSLLSAQYSLQPRFSPPSGAV